MSAQHRTETILGHIGLASTSSSSSSASSIRSQSTSASSTVCNESTCYDGRYRYTLDPSGLLTPDQRAFYDSHGYLLIPSLVSTEEIETWRKRFIDIANGEVEPTPTMTVMRDVAIAKKKEKGEKAITKLQVEQTFHTRVECICRVDKFCLCSAAKPDWFTYAINWLYRCDPVYWCTLPFQDWQDDEVLFTYCSHPNIVKYVEAIIGEDIKSVHTMLINKVWTAKGQENNESRARQRKYCMNLTPRLSTFVNLSVSVCHFVAIDAPYQHPCLLAAWCWLRLLSSSASSRSLVFCQWDAQLNERR